MSQPPDRRILSLPAVRPCEAASAAALLRALIVLAREIVALHLDAFPVHRHIAREAIREVAAILEFLEDVRGRASLLPASLVVSFAELHVTFQKMRHLLRDCARRGVRLWLLMQSDRVSCEFRILIRSIATALDVLPLAAIDAAPEVKELVRLVARQAAKVEIGTDPAGDRAVRSVCSILDQFKKGGAPAADDPRRVLVHLAIRSWHGCSEEIAFLEEEIFLSSDDDDQVTLLGSLMGFMVYCRVVLFDAVDGERTNRMECRFEEKAIDHLHEDDLRCPISLELMTDPVTIATGQTYDRKSIVQWLKAGSLTCPVTGEKLANTELLPNSTIQKLVERFCRDNSIPIPERRAARKRDLAKTVTPLSSAAAGAIRMAAAFLVGKLSCGRSKEKDKAAYETRKLSKSSIFNRICLVEAGSVPWLLYLFSSSDPSVQENAVAAILNLSKHPKGRTAIFEARGPMMVVDMIKVGLKVEARQNAAAILFYLASVEEYRIEIGEIPDAIPVLVDLLREGTYRGKKNAIVTLFGLLLYPSNHPKVLAAETVPVLINLLSNEREDLVSDLVAILAKLAERCEGTNAILSSGAVPKLVEVLHSSRSRSGRENCVSVLLSLCNNGGEKVISQLEKMPLLMPSLYSLLTEGSPLAVKKARSLLNYIHRFNDQQGYAAITTPAIRDRAVHAL